MNVIVAISYKTLPISNKLLARWHRNLQDPYRDYGDQYHFNKELKKSH
jgi:hypothetical protein